VSTPRKPTNLLVIDDDSSIRELLVEYLATRGYQVNAAADGRIALELMQTTRFNLVLTDYQVPHLDGLDLLRVARQMDPPVPTILMTGYGSVDTAVAALKEGAADFLLKPFRLKRIHEAIQLALERARQHEADARLVSTVALFDFASTVRSRWQLRLLFSQVGARTMAEADGSAAALYVEDGDTEAWELHLPSGGDNSEVPDELQDLDLEQLSAALGPNLTLVDDHPSKFYPSTQSQAPGRARPAWLAARAIMLDSPGEESRMVGALVVIQATTGERPDDRLSQCMTRYASLVGNTVTRVALLDPSVTPPLPLYEAPSEE